MKVQEPTQTTWTVSSVAAVMNRLPFVTWDRLGRGHFDGWGDWFNVFGWIEREDGRFDFVTLDFSPWSPLPGTATSSARYSREIAATVADVDGHADCERVEHVFGDLVERKVVLA